MSRRLLSFVAVLLGSAASFAPAQTPAAIRRIVRDSTVGTVPRATVNVVNDATDAATELVTDAGGEFRADVLVAAEYRIEASLDGFETAVRRSPLTAGQE